MLMIFFLFLAANAYEQYADGQGQSTSMVEDSVEVATPFLSNVAAFSPEEILDFPLAEELGANEVIDMTSGTLEAQQGEDVQVKIKVKKSAARKAQLKLMKKQKTSQKDASMKTLRQKKMDIEVKKEAKKQIEKRRKIAKRRRTDTDATYQAPSYVKNASFEGTII